MEVCRMRNTPVIIFVNKLDRDGKEAFDLLDELESKLNIKVCPLSWPIGMGDRFKGVYNIYKKELNLFSPNKTGISDDVKSIADVSSKEIDSIIGENPAAELREELEMIAGVYNPFDRETYLSGEVAPVFFGSAVNNFGVQELLNAFCEISPSPRGRESDQKMVNPDDPKFSGFVFKIHANLDPCLLYTSPSPRDRG